MLVSGEPTPTSRCRRVAVDENLSGEKMDTIATNSIRIVCVLLLCVLGGCAESSAQRAQRIEPMLSQAGFSQVPANTPAREEKLKDITPLKLRYFSHDGKPAYWFADPYVCHCLFRGTEQNYTAYQQLLQDEKAEERAQAIDDYQSQQQIMDYMSSPAGQVFYGQ